MEAIRAAKPSLLCASQESARVPNAVAGTSPSVANGAATRTYCVCSKRVRRQKQNVGSRNSSWLGAGIRGVSVSDSRRRQQRGAIVCEDRRIRWDNEDEGWVGGAYLEKEGDRKNTPMDGRMIPLVLDTNETHYKFLGILPTADIEMVRIAFRKLAPVYHPDTSTLPKEVAAEKFMRLREAYEVLSDEPRRRMYDWQLALKNKPDDVPFIWPYETDPAQWGPNGPGRPSIFRPEDLDKDYFKEGNIDLSPQSQSALAFDIFAFAAAIATAIFVLIFKQPSPS